MNKAYEKVYNNIVSKLEAGDIPWIKPWTGSGFVPRNLKTKHRYSGINRLVLMCQDRLSPYWLTFNQIKAMGGFLRKGSKGVSILRPMTAKKTVEVKQDDGSVAEEERQLLWFRGYYVFSLEDVDRVEDPSKKVQEDKPEILPIEAAEQVWEAWEDRPEVTFGGGRACYSPLTDKIQMPKRDQFHTAEGYYSTLFHEGAHATGHQTRLNRDGVTQTILFGKEAYSREELVAEFASAFLCAEVGLLKQVENQAGYIKGWLKALHNDPNMLMWSASRAEKAANHILGKEKRD